MMKRTSKVFGVVVPEGPASLKSEERPNPWISTSGYIAHPDSPRGSGGAGYVRIPGTVDGAGKLSVTVPQPNTLIGRNHVLSSDDETALENSKKPLPKKNPPPRTKVESFSRKTAKNANNVAVDLTIKVLADANDHPAVATKTADTGVVKDTWTVHFDWADIVPDTAMKKVTAVTGINTLKGLIELQIRYGPGVKPEQKVAYGRGTTFKDKANGDITIGFHEHCHLDDWCDYLKTGKLPLQFKGKVGMSITEYQDKQIELEDAFELFIKTGDTQTHTNTDQVGNPTKSQYEHH